MTTLDAVRQHRSEILALARKHGAANVRIFGSVLRGEDKPDSDIDLLIDAPGPTSPWFPAGLFWTWKPFCRGRSTWSRSED